MAKNIIDSVEETSAEKRLHTARVGELVNSNEPPRVGDAPIREICSQYTHRLKELDEQILQAEKVLKDLKAAREQVAADAAKYNAVFHPIRRLPDEILSEIFLASICTDFWSQEEITDADCQATLWLLTQICRRWRNAAIGCCQLWSYIVVDLVEMAPTNGAVMLLRIRLERSRLCPLSIWLDWDEDTPKNHALLLSLLPCCPRWETLLLTGSYYPSLLPSIRGSLPLLQNLYLEIGPYTRGSNPPITWFETAPSLRRLYFGSDPSPYLLPWSQLSVCETTSECELPDPFHILSKTINLQRADISLSSSYDRYTNTPCTLSQLTLLSIDETGNEKVDISQLLDNLTLPALHKLQLLLHCSRPLSILSLIERSNAPLQILNLGRSIRLDSNILTQILEAAPRIQKIDLEADKCFTDSVVDQLIIKPDTIFQSRLAPCLRKIYLWGILPCSAKLLIQMVESRGRSESYSLDCVELHLNKGNPFSTEELVHFQSCVKRGFRLWNGEELVYKP